MQDINPTFVQFVVAAVVGVILAATILRKPQAVETFRQLRTSYDELLKRKVALVRRLPPRAQRDPGTVYFVVDAGGRLVRDPHIPYEGQEVRSVLTQLQSMFGTKAVESVTSAQARRKDKVQVVYDARTQLVTKLRVPRQWAMPPRRLGLKNSKRTVAVLVNPREGVPLREKTLVLQTGRNGRVTSATLRG